MAKVWGFLRETTEAANKAGLDITGLPRTGLNEYLSVIFPKITDWVHNKAISKNCKLRPDYRSDSLKLIVEFDGIQHFNNPKNIILDEKKTKIFCDLGYKVVRIPYFLQLTNDVVEILFGVRVEECLFDGKYPSLNLTNSPAYLCPAGIELMAKIYLDFPYQRSINITALENYNNPTLSGVGFLKETIAKLDKS